MSSLSGRRRVLNFRPPGSFPSCLHAPPLPHLPVQGQPPPWGVSCGKVGPGEASDQNSFWPSCYRAPVCWGVPPPIMEAVYLSIYCSHSDKALVLALVPLLVRSKT